MARVLTGIQSSGKPHLGNILGAIKPAIDLSRESDNESLFFIADLHSFTSIKNPELLKQNTYSVAAAWLAFGFDTDKNIFYRQSDVTEVCELQWYLNCITPYPMLANAHSFKDKSEKLGDVNAGLFTYPVLMAADILLYDANLVPVGKDQIQHLEMARDIAIKFNATFGHTFVVPEAKISTEQMTIPGTDGQKMSKSYGNTIDIFLPEKELKKTVMSIITDSLPVEAPKNPDTCNVFKIYSSIATKNDSSVMRNNYIAGNYGYGQAKTALFELILNTYQKERENFNDFFSNKHLLEEKLNEGKSKAKEIAAKKLKEVRTKIGY